MIKGFKDIGIDILDDAAAEGMGINAYLQHLAAEGEIDGDFLIADPMERAVKAGGRDISPIGYMAARANLTILGKNSSTVEDVRASGAEPIFWNALAEHTFDAIMGRGTQRTIHTGDMANLMRQQTNVPITRDWRTTYDSRFLALADIVSLNTTTDSPTYKGVTIEKINTDGLSRVAEGMDIPYYRMKSGDTVTTLVKRGAAVEITYEVDKFSRINEKLEIFAMVAEDERERRIKEGVKILLNGNGNNNAAITSNNGNAAAWDLNDFNKWSIRVGADGGNDINMVFANVDTTLDIAALATPAAGSAYAPRQVTMDRQWGKILPDGTPLKVLRNGTQLDGVNAVVGMDASKGLWSVTVAGMKINEKDKNIRNQTIWFTHTEFQGFDKPSFAKTYQLMRAN